MAIKILKTLEPADGTETSVLGLLKRSRDLLSDEAHWVSGDMFNENMHGLTIEQFDGDWDAYHQAVHKHRQDAVEALLRDGLCGSGWGVCAVGAVSLNAGLNAIIEESYEAPKIDPTTKTYVLDGNDQTVFETKTRRFAAPLVNEGGHLLDFGSDVALVAEDDPRVVAYREAVKLLNEVATEEFDDDVAVWSVNDGDYTMEGKTSLESVLTVFDRAIEKAGV